MQILHKQYKHIRNDAETTFLVLSAGPLQGRPPGLAWWNVIDLCGSVEIVYFDKSKIA